MKKTKLRKEHKIKKLLNKEGIELSSIHLESGLFMLEELISVNVKRFSKIRLNKKEIKSLKNLGYSIGGL